jgi:hypothetical protein
MSEFNWNEFDAKTVETPSRDPLPAGEYIATVSDSAIKSNKAGTGEYLSLTFQIAEGEYEGRFVWANLNLVHPNEKAVQIARAELAGLCKAVDVLNPKDSADLHNKPVLIRVVVDKDRDGNPRNVVKGFKPVASQPAKPAAPVKTEAKSSTAPWKKK